MQHVRYELSPSTRKVPVVHRRHGRLACDGAGAKAEAAGQAHRCGCQWTTTTGVPSGHDAMTSGANSQIATRYRLLPVPTNLADANARSTRSMIEGAMDMPTTAGRSSLKLWLSVCR